MKKPTSITNKTWAQLRVGDSASIERVCADRDLFLFAHVSGNTNPLMLPGVEGEKPAEAPIAPSMWVGSLVSAVLGNILPGPGTLYLEQNLQFFKRVHVGDRLKRERDLQGKARRARRRFRHLHRQWRGRAGLPGPRDRQRADAQYRDAGARIAGADHGGKGAVSRI